MRTSRNRLSLFAASVPATHDRAVASTRLSRRLYTYADILLLSETLALHAMQSGQATMALLRRANEVFGIPGYERLENVSLGHLYNLRHLKGYVRVLGSLDATRPTPISEGR